MSNFLARYTSRPWVGTVGTVLVSVGTIIGIWQTEGIPVTEKVNTTIGALLAIATATGIYAHSETKKDGIIEAAKIDADARDALGDIVKAEVAKQVDKVL